MSESQGHIELERSIDSITVGTRQRTDLGDLDALMASIREVGLLQPITITPDGLLVCGWRRLEAMRRLGMRTLKVWVRSGISDDLSRLLAQREENTQRKPLNEVEAATLYREYKALMHEEAKLRQQLTRFGSPRTTEEGSDGPAHCAGPGATGSGTAREQAARAITGRRSYNTHERVGKLMDLAEDATQPLSVRDLAAQALDKIETGESVFGWFTKVMTALDEYKLTDDDTPDEPEPASTPAPVASAVRYRSLRSFVLTWTELEGWPQHYDVDQIGRDLKDEDWERFERVLAETAAFADRLREVRKELLVSA